MPDVPKPDKGVPLNYLPVPGSNPIMQSDSGANLLLNDAEDQILNMGPVDAGWEDDHWPCFSLDGIDRPKE